MKHKAPHTSPQAVAEAIETSPQLRRYIGELISQAVCSAFSKPTMSQSKAYAAFGRRKVERWVELGIIKPRHSGMGKRIDYFTSELIEAQKKDVYL